MRTPAALASLQIPNYRRYYLGQAVSRIGTWLQTVGITWLVLQETGSATWVGTSIAAQTLPLLLLTPYAGLLADRYPKVKLLAWVQLGRLLVGVTLAALATIGAAPVGALLALALLAGIGQALDSPARQALVPELVGEEHLANAVSLNSLLSNTARLLGPALAGALIALGGTAICFYLDSLSYLVMLVALWRIDQRETRPSAPTKRSRGQLREGLKHVRGDRHLWVPLAMMSIIGTLTYEFPVTLPVLADRELGGGAATYGLLMSAMGGGAILGAIWNATRRSSLGSAGTAAALFGIAVLAAALAPTLPYTLAALVVVGVCGVTFTTNAITTMQLAAGPAMRGRTMALWVMAFQGSATLGGPLVGWIAETYGANVALGAGGVAALVTGVVATTILRFTRRNCPRRAQVVPEQRKKRASTPRRTPESAGAARS